MYNIYYIESPALNALYNELKKTYKVFSPIAKESESKKTDYCYENLTEGQALVYNAYRTVEPLKSFFTSPYEKTADYFTPEKNITDIPQETVVFGVKNCDLAGHKVQDFVFLEGVEVDASASLSINGERPSTSLRTSPEFIEGRSRTIDALYRLKREKTIFISGDCTDFKEVCHCLAWDILPYPDAGFDLNLSPLNDGYLVEVGSRKGEEITQQYKKYLTLAKGVQISARRNKRESLVERLRRHILPQNLVSKDNVQKLVREGYNLDTWRQFMLSCVECGGCNFICDTCHCFLLADKKQGYQNTKVRVWDACQYANFARVAGGANPLKTRTQRLRNRFMKKFDFFVDNLGMPACCGCGRCIEVCPGKIDIREVLKDLNQKIAVNDK